MRNEDEVLRKFGILVLCLVFVDNTSYYESELGKKVFCPKNKCEIIEGNEYFEIKDPKLKPGEDAIMEIYNLLDPFVNKVNKGCAYVDEAFDDKCYDLVDGVYRFRLTQDL